MSPTCARSSLNARVIELEQTCVSKMSIPPYRHKKATEAVRNVCEFKPGQCTSHRRFSTVDSRALGVPLSGIEIGLKKKIVIKETIMSAGWN